MLIKGILPLTTLITEQQYKALPSKPSTPQYLGPGGWAASHLKNPFQNDRKKPYGHLSLKILNIEFDINVPLFK